MVRTGCLAASSFLLGLCACVFALGSSSTRVDADETASPTPVIQRGDVNCDFRFNGFDVLDVLLNKAGLPSNVSCAQQAMVGCEDVPAANAAIVMLNWLAGTPERFFIDCSPTPTPSPTDTPTPTATPTPTPTMTPNGSGSPTPTVTPTATPTGTPTATPTGTPTPTPSPSPTPEVCDQTLMMNSTNPLDAAKAVGLCSGVTAAWVLPNGSTPAPTGTPGVNAFNLGHGILPGFGSNVYPQQGIKLLAISSGNARDVNDIGWSDPDPGVDKGYPNALPTGFPRSGEKADGEPCSQASAEGRDGIGLQIQMTVPQNATGFSFDFDYYTDDYPQWICSPYMDQSAVMLNGANILVDDSIYPQAVNVNSLLIQFCENGAWGGTAGPPGTKTTCVNTTDLTDTGFDRHPGIPDEGAATGWRTATHSVTGGQAITLVFTIWDTSDYKYDSTILFDNFRWNYD